MISAAAARRDLGNVYVTVDAREVAMPGADPLLGSRARDCLCMHRVEWRETRCTPSGRHLVHRFGAPDLETVRTVLRRAGISYDAISTRRPADFS